ncbi:MAG: glycosyltransferase [Phycisphaeraceae bacterium]|nr:glycosyltransferase [Phycisphaeraceae bacterium]
MSDARHSFPVMLVQCGTVVDHFAGLERALVRHSLACDRLLPDQPPVPLTPSTRVVVISDAFAAANALALRQARRIGATTVLLMDGLVEYRNTFVNPRVGAHFLRPAPVDIVACAGRVDQEVLSALGNEAVAAGLPRIDRMVQSLPEGRRRDGSRPTVLIATANQPAFAPAERARLLGALRELRAVLEARGLGVRWRLTAGLDSDLGVPPDTLPLGESLASASAVITTPSTLMVEAMAAGCPTGLLHVHPTPLWQPAMCAWSGGSKEGPDWSAAASLPPATLARLRAARELVAGQTQWLATADELVSRLLSPTRADDARQLGALVELHEPAGGGAAAAEALADLLADLIARPRGGRTTVVIDSPMQPAPRLDPPSRPRVVSCVVCDESAVGGVRTWSGRLARAFAQEDLGYDVRTLLIVLQPDAWRVGRMPLDRDDLTEVCFIDPYVDHTEIIHTVRDSLQRMGASIVLPNYTDLTYIAAAQLRHAGVRTVAIAHTDEPYYRDMIATYREWDAGVGVSRVCARWMAEIERATRGTAQPREISQITYGVPVAPEPRPVPAGGPLRLAYLGRMVQTQKRIDDLLPLIDGLESRRAPFEFHMVGDGPNLGAWRESLARRTLRSGTVTIHGARSAEWVREFLPTMDVSVLVSEFEGTSISMLEAMGAGVVPSVTAVNSGVDDWVRDGVSGVVVPVGEPGLMAQRLADLASDRARLASMSRAAWEKARADASLQAMARQYRRVFDSALAHPAENTRSALGLHLRETWRWFKRWAEEPQAAVRRIEAVLRENGYARIAHGSPSLSSDAVIIDSEEAARDADILARSRGWADAGLAVVFSPSLTAPDWSDADRHRASRIVGRMEAIARRAQQEGCGRIVVFGAGKHTRRVAGLFVRGLPIVGIMDDHPPVWEYMFGLPVLTPERAIDELRPDAVLLSSDAFESQMWERCRPLMDRGVRVLPVYAAYEEPVAAV